MTPSYLLKVIVLGWSLWISGTVFAQDISRDQISVDTDMAVWNGYTIDQILDGITADTKPYNGFTTNSKAGTINFNFDSPHDVDGIKIWNDVNVGKEGIKDFELEFENSAGETIAGQKFTALAGKKDVQYFEFPREKNVIKINLVVLSSHNEGFPATYRERIEAREVAFTGVPSIKRNKPLVLSFNPSRLTVKSEASGKSILKFSGDLGLKVPPQVSCTNGGSYSNGTMKAPAVRAETISICTATARDEVGNVAKAILRVVIKPTLKRTPPQLSFSPSTLQVRAGEREVSHFTVKDDNGIPRPPIITCTNGGRFNNPNFTAPRLFKAGTSVCSASATNGLGISGKGVLTVKILPPNTAPKLAFNPPNLKLKAGESAPVSIIAPQAMRPQVTCTSGGVYDGTKFIASLTTKPVKSQCIATVTDAAGNKLQSSLSVSINEKPFNLIFWTLIGLGLIGLGTFFKRMLRTKQSKPLSPTAKPIASKLSMRPSKPLERPENGGTLFAGSPLLAANVATPLSPAGQLTASHLQMLTGQFAILKPAYQATGRIGYAQEGKPTSEDYSFGTGFLITPNHVMTNRHVHGFYGHYLTSDEDCGGIEFVAEKDKDASDFIPFNGEPPLLLDGLDIAIYTLSRPAENRTPIDRVPIPTEELDGRAIAVIGYPDAYDLTDPDVLAVVEDDPIFAVKRISQGKIFRHSTDDDDPYGVQVKIMEDDKNDFPMEAICHNASTLGGSSGSAVVCKKTGDLIALHFGFDSAYEWEEAANFAVAGENLADEITKIINPVTRVTE